MSAKDLESKIDRLQKLKEEIREWNALVNEMKTEANELESDITTIMSDLTLKRAGTKNASASLSESIVPSVDPAHWNDLRQWAVENDYQEILPRSLNQTSYRELLEIGIDIPHVEPYTKVKLSLRKL